MYSLLTVTQYEGTPNEVSTMTGVIDASTNATIKLQNILTDSNIREFEDSDQKLLDHMRRQYIYLMDDLHGPSWHYRIESFNIKAGYLASLATVVRSLSTSPYVF